MSVGRVVQEGGGMPTPAAPGGGDDATAGVFSEVAGMDGGRITRDRQLCINHRIHSGGIPGGAIMLGYPEDSTIIYRRGTLGVSMFGGYPAGILKGNR